jgi:type III pantothenate kinase
MNLVLDFGNTRIKAALFVEDEITWMKSYLHVEELLKDFSNIQQAQNTIISSVTDSHLPLVEWLQSRSRFLLFEAATPTPLKNLYESRSTLGSDRLAASVGASVLHPFKNVLTIDAGTCIKYNFVNAANEFLGGAISPGLEMRLKAMNHFTGRLPLVSVDHNYEKLTGSNSIESLLSGALLGAAAEVDGMIDKFRSSFPDLQVVIGGGDAPYLCKQLKNRFFAHPNIVLYGLNTILNFNVFHNK